MPKLRSIVLSLCLAALDGAAAAQSPLAEARQQLIEDFAQVVAGTNVCTRYKPNLALLSFHAVRIRVIFNHPEVQERLAERTRFHAERIKGRSAQDICAALLRLYGPEGSNVRNLVRDG